MNQIIARPESAVFDPATFIGKGWSFAEDRDPRSALLGHLDDYSKVKLSTDWLKGWSSIDGETRRGHILEDLSSLPLNCDHFIDLWNNNKKIPKSWEKTPGYITFDGDVLRSPHGDRLVLCLLWSNTIISSWSRRFVNLNDDFYDTDTAAIVLG